MKSSINIKAIVGLLVLITVIATSIFLFLYMQNQISVPVESSEVICEFACSSLAQHTDNGNMCIMTLPLIEGCLSDNRMSDARKLLHLPEDRGKRIKLLDDVFKLQKYYKKNVSNLQYEYARLITSSSLEYQIARKGCNVVKDDNGSKNRIIEAACEHSAMYINKRLIYDTIMRHREVSSVSIANMNARWLYQFAGTMDGVFKGVDGDKIKCKFMYRSGEMRYISNNEMIVVYVETCAKGIGMYIYMPRGGRKEKYDENVKYDIIAKNMCVMQRAEAYLEMPVLDFYSSFDISSPVGIERVVGVQQISHMHADPYGVSIESATISYDDITLNTPEELIIDSDFMYAFIDESNGIIMCIGIVCDPRESGRK